MQDVVRLQARRKAGSGGAGVAARPPGEIEISDEVRATARNRAYRMIREAAAPPARLGWRESAPASGHASSTM